MGWYLTGIHSAGQLPCQPSYPFVLALQCTIWKILLGTAWLIASGMVSKDGNADQYKSDLARVLVGPTLWITHPDTLTKFFFFLWGGIAMENHMSKSYLDMWFFIVNCMACFFKSKPSTWGNATKLGVTAGWWLCWTEASLPRRRGRSA